MIIGIDNVINLLEANNASLWSVKDSAGTNIIFSAVPEGGTISMQDSKEKLENNLKTLATGNYSIEAWQKEGQKTSRVKTKFQIVQGETTQPANVGSVASVVNTIPQKSVAEMISEAIESERIKNKLEHLEADLIAKNARIKELEAEAESFGTRVGKRLEQAFGGMLDMNEAVNKSGAAVGNLDADSEAIASLLERWNTADADFVGALQGLVKLAETDKQKYTMGKTILMSNG